MIEYLKLLQQCAVEGVRQKNRTGIDTFMIPGGMMQFDLSRGFPILTTKKVPFHIVVAELIGFIRGFDSAEKFRELGCNIWNANANDDPVWLKNPNRRWPDDLGRIYGRQWRDWKAPNFVGGSIDQLAKALQMISMDPTSRRIIVTAWRPDELDRMALPPCHLLYQFLVEQKDRKLHMTMYMRSCDMFLGVPFNISSYALLLALVSKVMGYAPGTLTMFLADVHIYENHLDQVNEQLQRNPLSRPDLEIYGSPTMNVNPPTPEPIGWLENLERDDVDLIGYDPHPAIKATMAV